MAQAPTRYLPTDYPPKYRPLGYRAHEEPPAPPAAPVPPPRRRRALVLGAVIVGSLALHAGIAAAYLGGNSRPAPVDSSTAGDINDPTLGCDSGSTGGGTVSGGPGDSGPIGLEPDSSRSAL